MGRGGTSLKRRSIPSVTKSASDGSAMTSLACSFTSLGPVLVTGRRMERPPHTLRDADADRVSLLADFVEESRTAIGQAINVSLHAPNGPAPADLIRQIGALGIPFEGHAQLDSSNYLIAGDGNQISAVEAWAATPAEMALPPLRCDGSVDLAQLRQ